MATAVSIELDDHLQRFIAYLQKSRRITRDKLPLIS
jgi:hypothetical protein